MKTAMRTIAAVATATAFVGVAALPANAIDTTGGLWCDAPVYPTVQYKNNGPTEVRWVDDPNGNVVHSRSQYPPNYPVYNQFPRQDAASYYVVSYALDSTFEYEVDGFCNWLQDG